MKVFRVHYNHTSWGTTKLFKDFYNEGQAKRFFESLKNPNIAMDDHNEPLSIEELDISADLSKGEE